MRHANNVTKLRMMPYLFAFAVCLAAGDLRAQTIPNDGPGFIKWCSAKGLNNEGSYNFGNLIGTTTCQSVMFNELTGLLLLKSTDGLSQACKTLAASAGRSTDSAFGILFKWMQSHLDQARGSVDDVLIAAARARFNCELSR
jgi:hypothetical protein